MKKLYLPLFICFTALILSSCRKEYIANDNSNQTIQISVPAQAWQTYNGNSYRVSLSVPEITGYFNETGEVLVYLSYGDGVYEQIPEVSDNISYSFTHNTGNVTIYAQDLNGDHINPPDLTQVKIVLIPSNY